MRPHIARAMAWLPWLGVALLVAAALSPGTVTASRLVFQSPPTATPAPPPPPPTPTPPPPAPATDTPVPPQPEPAPAEALPTEAAPVELPPAEALPPEEGQPALEEPLPTVETIEPPVAPLQATEPPAVSPAPEAGQSPGVEAGQPIINWVKFWDTMTVTLAYPWLCCGIGLLLLVPVFLLYLEIKGRRPPPMPPEPLPTDKRGNKE